MRCFKKRVFETADRLLQVWAGIALSAVRDFLAGHPMDEVRFVLFSDTDLRVYEALEKILP